MSITNGYATLAEAKAHKRITSTDATDDTVIESLVEDASRLIDAITNRWFYAYTQTRYFDVPSGRELCFDADLVAVTTLTNGDGTVIASTEYNLQPINETPAYALRLKDLTTVSWQPSSTYGSQKVISIAGSWGYVDRTATTPWAARVILNTKRACLSIFGQIYEERFGTNTAGAVTVTAAGVVITPYGAVPKAAYQLIAPYIRRAN